MCSSAPDTSGVNAAAKANAEVSKEALDWYKQQYADQAPLREAASTRANAVSDAQLSAMRDATGQAQDVSAYNKRVFRPLEEGIVNEAQGYDTQAREDQAAGRAVGDVSLASATARAEGSRSLTRMGVNPSDGAYGAMERATDTGTTLAEAEAANRARTQVQATGRAMKADAANLGRGLPSQQASQQSLAMTTGNSSAANAATPLTLATQGADEVGRGYNTAVQANTAAGNLYGSAANLSKTDDSALWSTIGSVAGAAIMAFSDKNMKKDRKPVKGEVALSAVRKMPVDSWRYKKGSRADDGGQKHIGPMAQDVNRAMGEQAAPQGKKVDLISLAGVSLAAVRELDKKVTKLAAKRA